MQHNVTVCPLVTHEIRTVNTYVECIDISETLLKVQAIICILHEAVTEPPRGLGSGLNCL